MQKFVLLLLLLIYFNSSFSQDNIKEEKVVIADVFGISKYEIDSIEKNLKNGFYKFISLDSSLKLTGNFKKNLKNGKFLQEILNIKKTDDGVYHQISSNSEGFFDYGKITGKWRCMKSDVIISSKKDTNNYFLWILSNEGKDLSGELIIKETAHCTFDNGKFVESFFYQINDISISGFCNKNGLLDGNIVTDYFVNKTKMREIANYNKGILTKLTYYIGDDKELVNYDNTNLVSQFYDKMDTITFTAEINGKVYKRVAQKLTYADKSTPLRLQALAFWNLNNEISKINGSVLLQDGNVENLISPAVFILEESMFRDINIDKKVEEISNDINKDNNKLQKLVASADSLYSVKSYKEALENYSKAYIYNIDSVNDKSIESHLNNRISELKNLFDCLNKFDEAKIKYDNKDYYTGIELIKSCSQYDAENLIAKFNFKIKEIEDSIKFENYLVQISIDAKNLEYRKALENIKSAKLLKQNKKIDSLEITYKSILDDWVNKNTERNLKYKELNDKYLSYSKKADTLTLKLLEIKEYYHDKFDTCIGFLKSNEKEILQKLKSHVDYDLGKNEFKITDFWNEDDNQSLKDIALLKEKYDYHFTFIDKVASAIINQDSSRLRNFKKYVYIKDIILVFVKDM